MKQIREPKDRVYIQHVMDEVMYIYNSNEKYTLPKLENISKTAAQIEKPIKLKTHVLVFLSKLYLFLKYCAIGNIIFILYKQYNVK